MFKYIAIHIIRVILYVFHIFAINNRKIFFTSFESCQFICNPKYIFIDLHDKLPELKYVWCLNREYEELSKYSNVVTVNNNTLLYVYHILTSKVIITNIALRTFMPYRKKQIIINTWHGGGAYKRVGFGDRARNYWEEKIRSKFHVISNRNITWFISSCKAQSVAMHESYCLPYSKYLSIGMPRNDIFFHNNNHLIYSLKNKLNIPQGSGIVLYAPTHRAGMNDSLKSMVKSITDLDVNNLKDTLAKKYKKEFICLFKGHPGFIGKLSCEDMINVSLYHDMQELLIIADILITDYSSCAWDFSLTYKPCFIFAPDFDQYIAHRGFYTSMERWPYPLAKSNDELQMNITNFDKTVYDTNVKKHHEELGSYEQGTATAKVTELLMGIFK